MDNKIIENIISATLLDTEKVQNILEASTRKNKWIPLFKQYPNVPKMERDINLIFNKKYLIKEII